MPAWQSFLERKQRSRGLGGSIISSTAKIICTGGHAIVRRSCSAGSWMAFAIKYRGEDRVTLCPSLVTERSSKVPSTNAFEPGALYRLPVLFIWRTNLFAMGTSVKRSTSLRQIVDRAEGYDIPGEIVDGDDFREVRDKVAEIEIHSKESHPAFLEMRTYRLSRPLDVGSGSYRTSRNWRSIGSMIRSRALRRSLRARELTNEQFRPARQTGERDSAGAENSPRRVPSRRSIRFMIIHMPRNYVGGRLVTKSDKSESHIRQAHHCKRGAMREITYRQRSTRRSRKNGA